MRLVAKAYLLVTKAYDKRTRMHDAKLIISMHIRLHRGWCKTKKQLLARAKSCFVEKSGCIVQPDVCESTGLIRVVCFFQLLVGKLAAVDAVPRIGHIGGHDGRNKAHDAHHCEGKL